MQSFASRGEALKFWVPELINNGHWREGPKTHALFNVQFRVEDAIINADWPEWRKPNMQYQEEELRYYDSEDPVTPDYLLRYKLWREITDSNGINNNNYGYLANLNQQYWKACMELRHRPDSRRAAINIYNSQSNKYKNDRPCTMSVQWYIHENKLYTSVQMRSNDVWFGFVYDAYYWTLMGVRMLRYLDNVELGPTIWNVTDFHIYQNQITYYSKSQCYD